MSEDCFVGSLRVLHNDAVDTRNQARSAVSAGRFQHSGEFQQFTPYGAPIAISVAQKTNLQEPTTGFCVTVLVTGARGRRTARIC